ncbi:MAG: AAA family ATPase [Deltaproteobacteria bacterium]|nr:AAA family ATPase [Deltaproteobacteria bacterium]
METKQLTETEESTEMKQLTLGDLSFQRIREGNYIYADKTEYIYNMLAGNRFNNCFLSRPRRFGKTLLLTTIRELFQGDRELFRGLWIDNSDYKFERHPVLDFTMTYINVDTKDKLIGRIMEDLESFAVMHGVTLTSKYLDKMFEQLLKGICEKYEARAVILVDEYDVPVTDHLRDEDVARGNIDVLHSFYRSLKSFSDYVHFAFVTGISRFAMAALDSGPNNFTDISLLPEFAAICGFTMDEMDTIFGDRYVDTLDILISEGRIDRNADIAAMKNKIEYYYDGYNWLGKDRVLNPFSLIRFFFHKKFGTFWPKSGKPSHLSELVRENPLDYIRPKLVAIGEGEITDAELSVLKPVPVLFHSGYLTIDRPMTKDEIIQYKIDNKELPDNKDLLFAEDDDDEQKFILKISNREVAKGFEYALFHSAFDQKDKFFGNFAKKLPVALLNNNSKKTASLFHDLLAAISFEQHEPSEKHYHAVLQAAIIATGLEVIGQASGSQGKSDMSAFFKNTRVVIEVKYCRTGQNFAVDINQAEKELAAALDKAADQIKSKDYAAPFRVAGKNLVGVAIAVRGRDEVAVRFIEP